MSNNNFKKYRKVGFLCLFIITVLSITGCRKKELPIVNLSLWADEGNMDMIYGILEDFQKQYENEVKFEFTVSPESELTCKETVLASPESAADVYIFADDQFEELWKNHALLPITYEAEAVIEACGGPKSGAVEAASRDGQLYAYPMTAGNGYFLYYNSSYFNKKDIKSMDRILEICAQNKKKMGMDFLSGWYIYSFFKGAGLELKTNEEGTANICNWNAVDTKYTGVEVVESMLKIAENDGFLNGDDAHLIEGIKDGTIIAAVNGAWNAEEIQQMWGDNYAAAKLPEYTLAGDQVQMCSFAGYKLVGVNAYTDNSEWSMKLAAWLTNEDSQLRRFQMIGECPVYVKVAESEEVKSAPAIAALTEQSVYGNTQSVKKPFWDASTILGATIAGGNSDHQNIQELLDKMVADATVESVQ